MADHVEQVPQSRFQRLLFVDSHLPTSLPVPRAHERFVITALLRRRTDVSSRAFYRQVENDLASRLHHERGDLALASLKVYRDVSAGGILSFFLQITRSHAYTAFLCRVLRRAPPPPYRIRYGVLYDNVVQITFERHPESSQLDGVLGLLRSPEISAAECTVLGGLHRQFAVWAGLAEAEDRIDERRFNDDEYDDGQPEDEDEDVFLVFCDGSSAIKG